MRPLNPNENSDHFGQWDFPNKVYDNYVPIRRRFKTVHGTGVQAIHVPTRVHETVYTRETLKSLAACRAPNWLRRYTFYIDSNGTTEKQKHRRTTVVSNYKREPYRQTRVRRRRTCVLFPRFRGRRWKPTSMRCKENTNKQCVCDLNRPKKWIDENYL